MKIKGVIFDMDGLMFDTEYIYYKAWQDAAKDYGYEITWEIYTQLVARNSMYIGKVLKSILGEDMPYEAILNKKRAYSDAIIEAEGIKHKQGLLMLLDYLEVNNIKKAVATSSEREKALRYLELGGIKERFDGIVCGSDVHESKPNPEIFMKAATLLGLDAEECMVLEDSRLGICAAKRADMYGVFVPDLVAADEEIKGYATKIVNSLEDVKALLEAMQ